jgi:hypothetical protein
MASRPVIVGQQQKTAFGGTFPIDLTTMTGFNRLPSKRPQFW